jgi:hypothetical protein
MQYLKYGSGCLSSLRKSVSVQESMQFSSIWITVLFPRGVPQMNTVVYCPCALETRAGQTPRVAWPRSHGANLRISLWGPCLHKLQRMYTINDYPAIIIIRLLILTETCRRAETKLSDEMINEQRYRSTDSTRNPCAWEVAKSRV